MRKFIIILILLLICLIGLCSYGCNKKEPIQAELTYDYALAAIAKDRVEKAQYLPDVNKLAVADTSPQNASDYGEGNDFSCVLNNAAVANSSSDFWEKLKINQQGFNDIVETLGIIDYNGAGKYPIYNIYDIKAEIYYVLSTVPAFNQWFRLPPEGSPFDYIPYYEHWAYHLEYFEDKDEICITRVSWACQVHYNDQDDNIFEVMRTRYYYDNNNNEVVECFIYNAVVTDVENKYVFYSSNTDNYHPVAFQYLKNVRDNSLIKYNIVAEEFGWGGDDEYRLLKTHPYGSNRSFVQLNYSDENNIQMLTLAQILPNKNSFEPKTTRICFYNKIDDYMQAYTSVHSYLFSNEISRYFDEISTDNIKDLFDEVKIGRRIVKGGSGETIERKYFDFIDSKTERRYFSKYYLNNALYLMAENSGVGPYAVEKCETDTLNDPYSYESFIDAPIDEMCKTIVNNSFLKKEWPDLYRESALNSIELTGNENISAVSQAVLLKDSSSDISVENSNIDFSLSGSVESTILLENGKNYSIGLALRSDDGTTVVLSKDYKAAYTHGQQLILSNTGSVDINDVLVSKGGTYTMGYVLTKKQGEKDIVCSDFINGDVAQCNSPSKESVIHNGFSMTYSFVYEGNTLKMIVEALDIQQPTITNKEGGATISVESSSKVYMLMKNFEITDNDQIASIEIKHNDTVYELSDTIVAGEHTLTATDRSGNKTDYEFVISIM